MVLRPCLYTTPGPSTLPVTGKTHRFFTNRYMARSERISFAKQWKLVADSSQFHFTLSITHRAHFSQLEIRKKREFLSEKRESVKA